MGDSWTRRWRRLTLSFLFSLVVSAIMLVALALVFGCTIALSQAGLLGDALDERMPLFQFSVASLMVGMVVAFVFSNRPLKPIRSIMEATDRIASGDYSVRLNLEGPTEMRELSDSFNRMAQQLASVEKLRSEFVGNVSHEFKTPIMSIRGFATQLLRGDVTEEQYRDYLEIIAEEAERLSQLSSSVLSLSKVDSVATPIDCARFDLTEQLRKVCVMFDGVMEARGIDLAFSCDEMRVLGNEGMLEQVWINLIDNAVKFSPEHGLVMVDGGCSNGFIRISIANGGPQLDAEVVERMFDRFYQGDASRSTAGNGLGLAIARKIVDLHGGGIAVHSEEGMVSVTVTLSAGSR